MKILPNMYQIKGKDSDSTFKIEISRCKPDWFTDNKIQLRIEKTDDSVYANLSIEELKDLKEAITLVINENETKSWPVTSNVH